jgi:hypothetical protein
VLPRLRVEAAGTTGRGFFASLSIAAINRFNVE